MNETVLNSLPSTGDLPKVAGGQDMVEAILTGARKRYKWRSSRATYIGSNGAVCAVGAVCREVGTGCSYAPNTHTIGGFERSLKHAGIESQMIDAAKTAIELLNASAEKLYGDEIERICVRGTHWVFPLEILNQGLGKRAYRKAVLACYDDAITGRVEANAKLGA